MTGNLFILSAPSGAGKTTLLKEVMERVERLSFSVSHTTREPRTGEQDGKDYYFVSDQVFEQMIEDGQFLEWARVHDNYYGTAREPIREKLAEGYDVVLDIDVQGTDIIRQSGSMDFIDIFIAPPDMAELENRLRNRGTEDEGTIARRMANAEKEMAQSEKYEYLIINDQVERGVALLSAIILAQRARQRRDPSIQGGESAGERT